MSAKINQFMNLEEMCKQAVEIYNLARSEIGKSILYLKAGNKFGEIVDQYDFQRKFIEDNPSFRAKLESTYKKGNRQFLLDETMTANREHMAFEQHRSLCMYHYIYNGDYGRSLEHLELSQQHIQVAIAQCEVCLKLANLSEQEINEFTYDMRNWTYMKEQGELHRLQIMARLAWSEGELAKTFDYYKSAIKEARRLNHIVTKFLDVLDPEYVRIEGSNLFGALSNLSIISARLLSEKKDRFSDISFFEYLSQIWDAYCFSMSAIRENPLWDGYQHIAENQLELVKEVVKQNRDYWRAIFIKFEDDKEFLKMMKNLDTDGFMKVQKDIGSGNFQFAPFETEQSNTEHEKIFISYSWKDSKVADTLEAMFEARSINLIRDVRDVEYKQSIKEFMKTVRKSDYVIMVISEHYLKSINCMHEVLEFVKDEDFRDRILPLVQRESDVFEPIGRIEYTKYWQAEFDKLNVEMQGVHELNRIGFLNELLRIEKIQRELSDFLSIVIDMKLVVFDQNTTGNDFLTIYEHIRPWEAINTHQVPKCYYLLNVPRTLTSETMIWWRNGDQGYTDDLGEARIFTESDIVDVFTNPYSLKKFSAIPVMTASKFNQKIVPHSERFVSIIMKNKDKVIGNSDLYLNKDEIELLI